MSDELPLAEASQRLSAGLKPGRRPRTATSGRNEQLAVTLHLQGHENAGIAKALDISRDSVSLILNRPHVKEFMAQAREAAKAVVLAGVVQTQAKAMQWLDQVATKKDDPKAFDAVARGIQSLERTGASASGETRPQVQVAVINQTQVGEEAKALIAALLADGKTLDVVP